MIPWGSRVSRVHGSSSSGNIMHGWRNFFVSTGACHSSVYFGHQMAWIDLPVANSLYALLCIWFQPRCWRGAHVMQREATPWPCFNKCPARASYRLELKRPSPQASYRTTESSAVSKVTSVWGYQITLQHDKGNSAQLYSREGQWEKMDKECPPQTKCCLKALGCSNIRGSCGLAILPEEEQRMSRGCLCDSSTGFPIWQWGQCNQCCR